MAEIGTPRVGETSEQLLTNLKEAVALKLCMDKAEADIRQKIANPPQHQEKYYQRNGNEFLTILTEFRTLLHNIQSVSKTQSPRPRYD